MTPIDDLDPPSFHFEQAGQGRNPEKEKHGEPEGPELEGGQPAGAEGAPPRIKVERVDAESAEPGGKPPPWRRLPFARSETSARVLVAIPWIAFAIFIVVVGGALFMLAMIALGALCLREFFRMTERARPVMLPAYAGVAAMVVAAHYGSAFQILLVIAACFPLIFAFAAARGSHDRVTVSIAVTLLGILWFGIGLSHATLLRDLPDHGAALLVDVLVATFLGDTAAYAAGRLFGARRITPRISPNKTLEGLVGGFAGATMGFWLAGLYQDWLPGIDALVMGMCIGLLAPVGDLFASMIKRDLAIKDTGTLFGPHGGLIDRLDAVLFTVVAGYYLSVAFVY
jgi:phosphatidate cytidylyltransferase